MKWLFAVSAALIAGTIVAQEAPSILQYAINVPSNGWKPFGPNQASRYLSDKQVQGGTAQRVEVRRAGANPWDDGVNAAIAKPITKGDRLVLAFWVRAPKLDAGETLPLPFAGITEAQTPYGQVVKGDATLTREWKLVELRGTADRDYAAGRVQAALQLSAPRMVVDLGPVFVLDLGQKR